jgi:hypothetical protein
MRNKEINQDIPEATKEETVEVIYEWGKDSIRQWRFCVVNSAFCLGAQCLW